MSSRVVWASAAKAAMVFYFIHTSRIMDINDECKTKWLALLPARGNVRAPWSCRERHGANSWRERVETVIEAKFGCMNAANAILGHPMKMTRAIAEARLRRANS